MDFAELKRSKIDSYGFINRLMTNGRIKRWMVEWLTSVWVYTNDGVVYKYVLQWDYRTLKKAKKHGVLGGEFEIFRDDSAVKISDEKIQNGRMMMKYNMFNKEITYWTGEDY